MQLCLGGRLDSISAPELLMAWETEKTARAIEGNKDRLFRAGIYLFGRASLAARDTGQVYPGYHVLQCKPCCGKNFEAERIYGIVWRWEAGAEVHGWAEVELY